MKLITMLKWACLFQLIIFLNSLSAQDLTKANKLFNNGFWDEACMAYEEIAFDNIDNTEKYCNTLLHKSYVLKKQNKQQQIPFLLSRCNLNLISDSLKGKILYETSLAFYSVQNYSEAEKNILPVLSISNSNEINKAAAYLYSSVLNEQGKWAESKMNLETFYNGLSSISSEEKSKIIDRLNHLFSLKKTPRLKKVKTARRLSKIFPGLGQFYNGNIGKGAISLSLVSLSGVFVYYNYTNSTYITGALAGGYLISAFYAGGVNQMRYLVTKKNTEKINRFNSEINTQLKEIYNQTP